MDTLRNHPLIGMGTATGGFIMPFIDAVSPYLQFAALCIGVLIGGFTLALKWREYTKGK